MISLPLLTQVPLLSRSKFDASVSGVDVWPDMSLGIPRTGVAILMVKALQAN
jgi:hypothetical protein